MKMTEDFKKFLMEYKIVGLAVAFIMGAATNDLVKSLVANIIMPITDPFISKGTWRTATLTIGPFMFGWGVFLAALLNFLIIALVIFIVVTKLIRNVRLTKSIHEYKK